MKEDYFKDVYVNSKQSAINFKYNSCYEYQAFDYQMIFIPEKHKLLVRKQSLSVILHTPDGLEDYLQSKTMMLSGEIIKSFGVHVSTGYLLVLPLAPFRWTVEIKINAAKYEMKKGDISLVYYYNPINKLYLSNEKKKNSQEVNSQLSFLVYLLNCMLFLRDRFKVCYVVPVSQNELYCWNMEHYHQSQKYKPFYIYFDINTPYNCQLFKQTSSFNLNYYIECDEIESINDTLPHSQISLKQTKSVWTVNDYLRIENDLGSIYSVAAESNDDVQSFRNEYVKLKDLEKQKNDISAEVMEKKEEYVKKQKEFESIPNYFFPNESINTTPMTNESKLHDVIVVIYDGNQALICLPKDNTFYLPVNYAEQDGNQIAIPYLLTSNEVKLTLQSNECDVFERSNEFVLTMNDTEIGHKKVKLTAVVCNISSTKELANCEFYLEYERISIPNRIVTSVPCYLVSNVNGGNTSSLYPTDLPVDIDVFKGDSKRKHIEVNGDKWKKILDKPSVEVAISTMEKTSYPNGTLFTWNDSEFYVFKKEKPTINLIEIHDHSFNALTSIDNLKSNVFSTFINTLFNLPIVIICAGNNNKQMILSILNGCINGMILPTIKQAAEGILKMVIYQESILRWINVDNISNRRKHKRNKNVNELNHSELYQVSTDANIINTSKSRVASVYIGKLPNKVINNLQKRVQAIIANEKQHPSEQNKENAEPDLHPYLPDEDFRSVNYQAYLDLMNKMNMNEMFESIMKRTNIIKYIQPSSNNSSLSLEQLPLSLNTINASVIEAIRSISIHIIVLLKGMNCMKRKPHSTINIIIDTNCSLRKNKMRMRTIVSCILVTILRELGISFNLYVLCGRYKGVYVTMEDRSVHEVISFLFAVEKVVKMPSTPLDLLTLEKRFDEKDPVVIISDGFSEQLMSQNDEVRDLFEQYSKLFLLCIKGKNDEALSAVNQCCLEKALQANFHHNMVIIEKFDDLFKQGKNILINLLFENEEIKMKMVQFVSISVKNAEDLRDMLKVEFKENKSLVSINTIVSTKSVKLVDISDNDLYYYPEQFIKTRVLRKLTETIQGENLFDAMSISLFVPNKSIAYIPSTSGTSIYMTNYIKYVVSKTGDGKFFKKLGGEKIRSYNASIIIDCSSIAFSETNRIHSLITIFSIVRNLSNMQLPCIDVWVASSKIIRIAAGIPSMDLWESNIVAALYESLLSPCQNTCLSDCIRFACCTCNARSFQSVMMILTNGVLCNESRLEIKSIVSGIEMTYLGIGIGLYLCGFEDLFPTMIWNSNPNHLSETLMNLTNASMSENLNAVPEKSIDGMIWNVTADQIYQDVIHSICNISSIYESALKNVRFVDTTDEKDSFEQIGDIYDSKYDLGVDGSFKEYSILFIILYLCRGIKDDEGKVIDEFITDEVLRNGIVVNEAKFSPILKLGQKEINGVPIGKGFNIGYAYNYKTAINELMSGKYRMTFITCSPGDGFMAKKCDRDVDQYADAFVNCVHEFSMRGGGVFWFLENYPFTYEADLYFKTFYGFEAVGDKDKTIMGGKVMKRVKSETPKAGEFITIGGDAMDIFNLSRLDFGIVSIFEGRTLCTLNEQKFVEKGFRIFARESEGNASIMVREKQEGSREGRMIIDTAASKLFLEFTEEGTARWISNAAVWLCNTEEFAEEQESKSKLRSGISMDSVIIPNEILMKKRETGSIKQVNFCMSIVMDTTGSMSGYINKTRDNILVILQKLKQIERDYQLPEGGIVGQVVQYKDYIDSMIGETDEYITSGFERLKKKLASFKARGGSSGAPTFCWCENIQGGLIRAIEQIKKPNYYGYDHLILIAGDYPNHLDLPDCKIATTDKASEIESQWKVIYEEIRSIPSIRIMFMPVSCGEIVNTMKRMQSELGPEIVDSAEATTETDFVDVITYTAVTEFKRFIGIT